MEFASPPFSLIEQVLFGVFGKRDESEVIRTDHTITIGVESSNKNLPDCGIQVRWDKEDNAITAHLMPADVILPPWGRAKAFFNDLNECLAIFLREHYPGIGAFEPIVNGGELAPVYVLDFDCTHIVRGEEIQEILAGGLYRGMHAFVFSHAVFQHILKGGKIPNKLHCFNLLWNWWCLWEMQEKKYSKDEPYKKILYPTGLYRGKYAPLEPHCN